MLDQNGENLVEFYKEELLSLHNGTNLFSSIDLRKLARRGIILVSSQGRFLSADTCQLLGVEANLPMSKSKKRNETKKIVRKRKIGAIVTKPPKVFLQDFRFHKPKELPESKTDSFERLVEEYRQELREIAGGEGVNLILDYKTREQLLEMKILKIFYDHGPKWQLSEKARKVL